MKTSGNNTCQSCGMPMNELSDFGTDKDDSINTEYCLYCYKKGDFTDPGITLEQKLEKNITIAEKMGMPREDAIALANAIIPKLKRWNRS
ncbi:MAG: zinc ribbon domain-containing protein [Maribacter sp.]|nr:zinc ribbon domain-containing protein [Maribacter sp.]